MENLSSDLQEILDIFSKGASPSKDVFSGCQALTSGVASVLVKDLAAGLQAFKDSGWDIVYDPVSNSASLCILEKDEVTVVLLQGTEILSTNRTLIEIIGARANNLKNIQVQIPQNSVTAITGVSGSGKSSLAFDTIYAEGQRRFWESSAPNTHSTHGAQLKIPDVDSVGSLPSVASIQQRTAISNPRSTVGTLTGLHRHLRNLFALLGETHCPFSHETVSSWSTRQLADHIYSLPKDALVEIRAPVIDPQTRHPQVLEGIEHSKHQELRIDNQLFGIDSLPDSWHTACRVEIVVDRVAVGTQTRSVLHETLTRAFKTGAGIISLHANAEPSRAQAFYRSLGASRDMVVGETLDPSMFSFNSPRGACPLCTGLGYNLQPDLERIVSAPQKSLRKNPFAAGASGGTKSWRDAILHNLAQSYGIDLDTPYEDLPQSFKDVLLFGTQGTSRPNPDSFLLGANFEGLIPEITRRYSKELSKAVDGRPPSGLYKKFMKKSACPACPGSRLQAQRRFVKIGNYDISSLEQFPLDTLSQFLTRFLSAGHLNTQAIYIVQTALSHLQHLSNLGLDYLTLGRPSSSLSGGESQRVRISTQICSGLVNMLYVLDEPSIGLHVKDKTKVIETINHLRDIGNTIIVVEHDEQIIRSADHIVEMGPGAGNNGGEVVASGDLEALLQCENSPTAAYFRQDRRIFAPSQKRRRAKEWIRIKGARANNLRNIDVAIPLGVFTCVTGVSGSGKSTLIHDVLYNKLRNIYRNAEIRPGVLDSLTGHEYLDEVSCIDQSPIGKSPRSNPATYAGFFDTIRKLFASSHEARTAGLSTSHFSFNTRDGCCLECRGEGTVRTSLSHLPRLSMTCPTCRGLRFNAKTLAVSYKQKTIADVLDMTICEGIAFFEGEKTLVHKLSTLEGLGLGYLKIGHPAPNLSDGESQRVKLANSLGKIRSNKRTLYILDEPTTGLHLSDIQSLLDALDSLVSAGNTVIVIEHHLDVVKTADHIIDMGPGAGSRGGLVVASGTPQDIVNEPASHTGIYLKPYLQNSSQGKVDI